MAHVKIDNEQLTIKYLHSVKLNLKIDWCDEKGRERELSHSVTLLTCYTSHMSTVKNVFERSGESYKKSRSYE